eukprot:scaffold30748_cov43-Prasinocladus_malaysianus.AAC.4
MYENDLLTACCRAQWTVCVFDSPFVSCCLARWLSQGLTPRAHAQGNQPCVYSTTAAQVSSRRNRKGWLLRLMSYVAYHMLRGTLIHAWMSVFKTSIV